jgi:hypothetical protein
MTGVETWLVAHAPTGRGDQVGGEQLDLGHRAGRPRARHRVERQLEIEHQPQRPLELRIRPQRAQRGVEVEQRRQLGRLRRQRRATERRRLAVEQVELLDHRGPIGFARWTADRTPRAAGSIVLSLRLPGALSHPLTEVARERLVRRRSGIGFDERLPHPLPDRAARGRRGSGLPVCVGE